NKNGKPGDKPGDKSNKPGGNNNSKDPQNQDDKTPRPQDGSGNTSGNLGGDTPDLNDQGPVKGSAANPNYGKKAGELQLEDFKKRVTKDVLQKANMTEEEYREFLKAYQEMLNRKSPSQRAEESDPKRGPESLSNLAPRRVDTGAKGRADQLQRGGAGLAP